MKRLITTLMIVLVSVLGASCSGSQLELADQAYSITPLHGSKIEDVSVHASTSGLTVRLHNIPAEGTYLHVGFAPASSFQATDHELDRDDALFLAVPSGNGVDLGVVPLDGYQGSPVLIHLLANPAKHVSTPPVGNSNAITDLVVSDAGAGQVSLTWTQRNTGDYDLNGEVNLTDLTPIGVHYQESYNSSATDAEANPLYWIDGDGNGQINISDITPIGVNYGAVVAGYNIRRNGVLIPGAGGQPTATAADATERDNLPNTFNLTLDGATTDTWVVTVVDRDGAEGADSTVETGMINLDASLTISGQQLFDLSGANPGAFGVNKSGARVIDPIEIINRTPVGDVNQLAFNQFQATDLPTGKVLLLEFNYLPVINLATGSDRVISGVHSTSAVEDNWERSSVPFVLPPSDDPVTVSASIDLGTANPAGGFFTDLSVNLTIPGDDPKTIPVETSYTRAYNVRLDNANGLVSTDTDDNGDFEDEVWLDDDDHDCVSPSRLEQEDDDNEYDHEDEQEIEIEGTLGSFDEAAGTITINNPTVDSGGPVTLPNPLTLTFSELTRFEERVKTDTDDFERDIDPSSLMPGDAVEVELYRLDDGEGGLPTKYWIEVIKRQIDLETED